MKKRSSIYSRYIKTTWKLSTSITLSIAEFEASIRFISNEEATNLNEVAQRNNPFIRYPYGNPFYPLRIQSLSDRTVIEIYKAGKPAAVGPQLDSLALLIETSVFLSSTLSLQRTQLHKCLAIDQERGEDFDIIIGPQFKSFRSRSRRKRQGKGILINSQFIKRFQTNGFTKLIQFCQSNSDLSVKVSSALGWLADSRQEPRLNAAIVKSSIALESLLIFNDNEPLARSLSERCAYLLTANPESRARISRVIRDFYEARSGVVHGGRRKVELISPRIIEAVDRFILLISLVLAANEGKWPNKDSLQSWCEFQKWDAPDKTVVIPFSRRYLQMAIKMAPIK